MKKYSKTFLFTCILTVLPMLAGILLWEQLPDTIATHFGSDGTPNGWSPKPFAVFGLPLFLLAVHAICVVATSHDPKYQNVNSKMMHFVLWICPVISIFVAVTIYGDALGYELNMSKYVFLFMGLLFIIIGNYLPKCRQNYTVGIKLPWTLSDEENWNHTHRLAGYLWMICGILMLVNAFIFLEWLMLCLFIIMILVPTVYSFIYHLKHGEKNKD